MGGNEQGVDNRWRWGWLHKVPNMMCLTPYALALVLLVCVKVRKAK
jgi:hypothetical protein